MSVHGASVARGLDRCRKLTENDYLGYDYATSLHLMRDETGAWSIVSKLFDGTPTEPS